MHPISARGCAPPRVVPKPGGRRPLCARCRIFPAKMRLFWLIPVEISGNCVE